MKPLTYFFGWTRYQADERRQYLREFANNGARHLVLSSALLEQGAANSGYLINFQAQMQEFGLDFTDAHAMWGLWSDPGMPMAQWREIMLLRHRLSFRLCQQFGVHTIAFHTGNTFNSVFGKDLTIDDYFQALIDSLEILIPEAEKCDVIIALENQWTPLNHTDRLLKVMEYFNSPNLGLCYDSGHGNLMEKGMLFPGQTCVPPIWEDLGVPVEWETNILEKFLPWLVNCHLHDNDGINDQHLFPGQGTVDWSRVKNALRQAPRLQNIQNESSTHPDSIAQSCRTFQELFDDF